MAQKRWKCTVCGYIHNGEEPPEKCPACGVDRTMFVEIDEDGKRIEPSEKSELQQKEEPESSVEQGAEAAEETSETVEAEEKTIPEAEEEQEGTLTPQEPAAEKQSRTFLDWIGSIVLKLHLHPIAVHTPNGVLPMAILFLLLATVYNYQSFEIPAFYSMAFVLLAMPFVLLTGYFEWQMRYRGAKTFLFITKIFCSIVVLAAVSTLVIWRFVDPGVTGPESPMRFTYLGVGVAAVAAAGIAGHLGGKLVFMTRDS